MSSRNRYSTPAERTRAGAVFGGLQDARRRFDAGEQSAAQLRRCVEQAYEKCGAFTVEYIEIADLATLSPLETVEGAALIATAVRTHETKTRLIDNRDGRPSAWSEPARWEMGLLKPADWSAQWIEADLRAPATSAVSLAGAKWIWCPEPGVDLTKTAPAGDRYFRCRIRVPAGEKPTLARLTLTVDDQFTLFVNGKQIGQFAELDGWKQPQRYDLLPHLQRRRERRRRDRQEHRIPRRSLREDCHPVSGQAATDDRQRPALEDFQQGGRRLEHRELRRFRLARFVRDRRLR